MFSLNILSNTCSLNIEVKQKCVYSSYNELLKIIKSKNDQFYPKDPISHAVVHIYTNISELLVGLVVIL